MLPSLRVVPLVTGLEPESPARLPAGVQVHEAIGGGLRSGFSAGELRTLNALEACGDRALGVLRAEGAFAALALALILVSAAAVFAGSLHRNKREVAPHGALATIGSLGAVQLLGTHVPGILALAVGGPGRVGLGIAGALAACATPAVEMVLLTRLSGTPSRFGLRPVALAPLAIGIAGALAAALAGPEVFDPRGAPLAALGWLGALAPLAAVTLGLATGLLIANTATVLVAARGPLRVVSIGLLVDEALAFAVGVGHPATVGAVARVLVLLALVGGASVIFAREAQRRDAQEREGRARSRAIAQTTTMFAHDVRKPIALVRMTLKSLLGLTVPPEVRAALEDAGEEIEETSRGVEGMIADILEGGGARAARTAPEDLGVLLAAALAEFERAARAVTLDADLRHTRQVEVERARIARVLSTLIASVLHAARGRGRIWLRSHDETAASGAFVSLTVGTAAAVVPPEQLPRVFDPFFSAGLGGAGLGLSIARRIVEAHDGAITCRSSPALGLELTVSLPASARPALAHPPLPARIGRAEEVAAPAPPALPLPRTGPRHVLLVEDSRAMRAAWRRRYPEGALREFESPTACLRAVEREPWLLSDALCIVLDNRFEPGEMDGLELGRLLRSRTRTPIFLCSAVQEELLPPCFDGQLPKEAHGPESIERALERRPP